MLSFSKGAINTFTLHSSATLYGFIYLVISMSFSHQTHYPMLHPSVRQFNSLVIRPLETPLSSVSVINSKNEAYRGAKFVNGFTLGP